MDRLAERGIQVPYLDDRDLAQLDGSPFAGSYLSDQTAREKRMLYRLLADVQGTRPLSLEALGLIEATLGLEDIDDLAGDEEVQAEETADWPGGHLRRRELRELLGRCFSLMRRQYLLTAPPGVDRPGFGIAQQYLVCEKPLGSSEQLHGMWNAAGQDTVYVDLLRRWCRRRSGRDASEAQLRTLIGWLFEGIRVTLEQLTVTETMEGVPVLALRHEAIRVRKAARLYGCDRCGSFATTHLGGVCPEPRYRGMVSEVTADRLPAARPESNMFVARYVSGKRCELRCEEHTAQLNAELGQDVQEAFQCGQVNVLSCSTTFELGIDLGDLQSIVLRNMPPSTANYLQRAGRAGRRSDAVAFVLTFCQRRPHDRHYFQLPGRMIAGEIRPPKIDLANEKILQRHCFAEVLSSYWEWLDRQPVSGQAGHFRISGNVGLYFEDVIDSVGQTPNDQLRAWLSQAANRTACARRLREAFNHLNTDSRAEAYLDLLADPDRNGPNPLARAACESVQLLRSFHDGMDKHLQAADQILAEVTGAMRERRPQDEVEKLRSEEKAERDLYYSFQRLLRQQRQEFLITYLMGRGVLPSFAFPVNVVKLHVLAQELRGGRRTLASSSSATARSGWGTTRPRHEW